MAVAAIAPPPVTDAVLLTKMQFVKLTTPLGAYTAPPATWRGERYKRDTWGDRERKCKRSRKKPIEKGEKVIKGQITKRCKSPFLSLSLLHQRTSLDMCDCLCV